MNTKSIYRLPLIAAACLLAAAALSGCHDTIYKDISSEVQRIGGVNGNASSIVECGGHLYLAAGHKGHIYWREFARGHDGFSAWHKRSGPNNSYIMWLKRIDDNNFKALLTSNWTSYGGQMVPNDFSVSTYSLTSNSWSTPAATSESEMEEFFAAVRTAGNRDTANPRSYTINSDHKGINGVELASGKTENFAYIHSISCTSDYVLLGTDNGLWTVPVSDISKAGLQENRYAETGYANIKNSEVLLVYAVDEDVLYQNTTIYVCHAPAGTSAQYQKNGLYAIYRGGTKPNEWNQDGTSAGN
ncbi:MAG: hypothetical protein II187_05370 [Treponema sp.]|nr:hypothetical protein [Treponema sp.]